MDRDRVGWVAGQAERLLANDVEAEPRSINLHANMHPTRSELSLPIRMGAKTWGVLDVQSAKLDTLRPIDVMVMETLTDPVASAMDNARPYQAAQDELAKRRGIEAEIWQKSEYLALINALNAAANRGDSLGDLLKNLAQEVGQLFSCLMATVDLLSEGGDYLVLQQDLPCKPSIVQKIEGLIRMKISEVRLPLLEGSLYREVLQVGRAHLINDPEAIRGLMREFGEAAGFPARVIKILPQIPKLLDNKSVLLAPLTAEGKPIGLLRLFRSEPFVESDLERIEAIAEELTVIVRRRQAEEELEKHVGRLEEMVQARTADLSKANAKLLEEVDQRVRAEREIRELNEQLDDRVRQRTAELEASNEELESFSYSVSHDLRAPLRAISGFSQILLEEHIPDIPAEARHYLKLVSDNTRQMGQLIDNLLTFSRFSCQPLAKREVEPAEVARQALDDLRAERKGRRVELSISEMPIVPADPNLLKQVFVNLIGNALKFTKGREVARVEVGCSNSDGEPVFFIKDNGVGFDMQYADKLFGVFQRLHSAEEFKGTGVGLAIVQRIVHRHGGRIWAEAEADKGATFYFTIGGNGSESDTRAVAS